MSPKLNLCSGKEAVKKFKRIIKRMEDNRQEKYTCEDTIVDSEEVMEVFDEIFGEKLI